MPQCKGTADNHCCWLAGVECQYLEKSGDRIACSLRASMGSWEAVHSSPEYLTNIQPVLRKLNIQNDCGDWPSGDQYCRICGHGDVPPMDD